MSAATGSPAPPARGAERDEEWLAARAARLKRFRTAIVLSVVFVLLLLGAYRAYPQRAAVNRPPPFTIALHHQRGVVSSLDVNVRLLADGTSTLEIVANLPSAEPVTPLQGTLRISQEVSGAACPGQRCRIKRDHDGTLVVGFGSGAAGSSSPGVYQYTLLTLSFRAQGFAWDSNGLSLEATLPSVTSTSCVVACMSSDTPVNFTYNVAGGAAYSWTGGPTPSAVSPVVVWYLTLGQLPSPTTVSATDLGAYNKDTVLTFVAGAILGIAGGALVGAIQEFMDSESRSAAKRAARRERRGAARGR